ncbi:hypothetical protein CHS0354_015699 [Potamilus streckersoni]|uniref:Fibronectin type III-like domain-containing protein n=1 Tax=Potamilus streckersoni TaxID=2493646 RepID=A0AAE0WD29_9BIVA|nr:hypothetical protein CHS0354_015699 [Potamilus streckersoni]
MKWRKFDDVRTVKEFIETDQKIPSLIYEVAEAISVEVRAKHNDFVSKKSYVEHSGLACFSPVINIMRHPLWGRNQETYGEDPYLSGVYAAHFASGLRGTHPRFYRAAAICKHFDAHGGPEDLPVSRLSFNAIVPERDLRMTYLPQFKACAQGGALGVMCSYNSLNGIPACANKKLLTDILRTEWGFDGFVVSDAGAIEFIIEWHHYLNNIIDTAAACVKAGLNLELHPGYPQGIFDSLEQVVNDGKLTKEMLVERVKPLFLARMKFGEFDPPETNPYTQLNLSDVMTPEHQALSLKTAVESFVLLKNKGFLPMRDRLKSIAIVGPFADNPDQIMGNYAPNPDPKTIFTPKTGLSPLADTSYVVSGCSDTKCLDYDVEGIIKAVSKADVTFLCVGTGQAVETENFDRPSMKLPGYQPFLIQDVIKKALGPVVLLVFSGGPVNIVEAVSADNVVAIIQCFFPNQGTGVALYQMITMKSSLDNPAGRLPFTWYATDEQIPSMTNYSMVNGTYRYFNGDPLFPFGYGLSYTTFQYNDLVLTPTKVKAGDNVTVTFNITNTGSLSGSEVYEVYMSWLNATVPTPKYQLVGFNRTLIDKGQTVAISTQINSQQMAVWVDGKGFVIEPALGPVVLLVFSGGPVNIVEAVSADNVVAIIQCFFPNQGTGVALYQMITMKSSLDNPAGRLPFTWYATDEQIPSMTNYSMVNGTYRYFNGDPLFPFGYGLSYTTFQYNDLVLTPTKVKAGDNVTVTFNITNTGSLSGSEVYEVYMSWLNATVPTPKYQLVGFNRTLIDKGQTVAISTQINSQQMAVWVDGKGFVIEPGDMVVYAGGQLPNQKVQVSSNILRTVFTIYT